MTNFLLHALIIKINTSFTIFTYKSIIDFYQKKNMSKNFSQNQQNSLLHLTNIMITKSNISNLHIKLSNRLKII